jgi:hypothetical protein
MMTYSIEIIGHDDIQYRNDLAFYFTLVDIFGSFVKTDAYIWEKKNDRTQI